MHVTFTNELKMSYKWRPPEMHGSPGPSRQQLEYQREWWLVINGIMEKKMSYKWSRSTSINIKSQK